MFGPGEIQYFMHAKPIRPLAVIQYEWEIQYIDKHFLRKIFTRTFHKDSRIETVEETFGRLDRF